MGKEQEGGERRGLGKVVYSVEPEPVREARHDESGPTDLVEEASEESFPASDPPGYAIGEAQEAARDPDAPSATDHPPHTEAWLPMTEHDREDPDR